MERIRLEIKRQPIHILLGLSLITLINYNALTPLILTVLITIGLLSSLWVKKTKPRIVYNLLQYIERKDDLKELPGKGLINYLIGALIVIVLFKKDIAMASIIILALGDSLSRLIGPFGKIKHPFNDTRFLEGVIAGTIAASLGAMLFVKPSEAITSSAIAMVLEGINIKIFKTKIDDNITIPLIAGTVIWLSRKIIL